MKTLIIATSNKNKLKEIREICPDFTVLGLADLGFDIDIEESGTTIEENAMIKANYLFEETGSPVIAEDTGLEVQVLGGAPGVHTARYAGDNKDPEANMDKLLETLLNVEVRNARFRTVIALKSNKASYFFEGIVNGTIARYKSGTGGFGYDPIFIPEGYQNTFAELSSEIKNKMSHRSNAVKKLLNFLQENPDSI